MEHREDQLVDHFKGTTCHFSVEFNSPCRALWRRLVTRSDSSILVFFYKSAAHKEANNASMAQGPYKTLCYQGIKNNFSIFSLEPDKKNYRAPFYALVWFYEQDNAKTRDRATSKQHNIVQFTLTETCR